MGGEKFRAVDAWGGTGRNVAASKGIWKGRGARRGDYLREGIGPPPDGQRLVRAASNRGSSTSSRGTTASRQTRLVERHSATQVPAFATCETGELLGRRGTPK